MDRIINGKLLLHPMNWLIVWTVLLFAGFAWTLAHEELTGANAPTAST